MAKKVTIAGSNLLSSLADAWGGTGDGSQVYGTTVPAGVEWGMNRGEVERFIKEQLNNKFGAFQWVASENFYKLQMFATEADKTAYNDGDTTKLLKESLLPISAIQADSYVAELTANETLHPTGNAYKVKDGSAFNIALRYRSLKIVGATSTTSNYGADGIMTVERSTDGGSSWTVMQRTTIQPSGLSAADYPITLALGDWLMPGTQNRFRIRVAFRYVDETDGATKTRTSDYVNYSVQSVSLGVTMTSAWEQPMTVATNTHLLSFTPTGAVAKTLHVTFVGSVSEDTQTVSCNAADDGVAVPVTFTNTQALGLFTHGIHEVRAWITCSDGAGGTLTSDVMVYHVMIVTDTSDTQPRLLLQEVASVIDNFVQARVCRYAVYLPEGNNTQATMMLTNSNNSILSAAQTIIARDTRTIQPEHVYDFDATAEMEQDGDTLTAYLHCTYVKADGTTGDLLAESTGVGYVGINVDNTSGFQPTAGSTFLLNPKTRSNSEANPARVLNARNGDTEVESVWTNFKFDESDGYTHDEEGNAVLRIPAGRTLNIRLNPLAQFLNTHSGRGSSLTMEFDLAMRNVVNEDDPIIRLCEQLQNGNWLGLRMRPLVGTFTTYQNTSEETTDFRIQEDVRTHISINIEPAIQPNVIINGAGDGLTAEGSTNNGTIALVRVFINGVINRELRFDRTSATEFCTALMSNGGFYIGQSGSDIDIYGIRIWAEQSLTSQNVVQDYISTIPDPEEKRRLKRENDIISSRRLDVAKVKELGRNVLIWHGAEPYKRNENTVNGWYEFYQYDSSGNLIPELSGTLCRESGLLPGKRQGTTANTYYYHNIQTKVSDVSTLISVKLTDLHESISVTMLTAEQLATYKESNESAVNWNAAAYIKGGCLGKNFPSSTESAQVYEVVMVDGAQAVRVPDGWVDGNEKYRGRGYAVAEGLPLAQKLVLKINYASSMQSHIIGVNRLYNDLHTAYVGENALQEAMPTGLNAVVAKHLEPFLFFTQANDNAPAVYRGPGAWGPGKMDKPTWGYVKSKFPMFAMFEGAYNNFNLADFRVPFDNVAHGNQPAKVYYDPDNEAYMLREMDLVDIVENGVVVGQELQEVPKQCLNFQTGNTRKVNGKEYPSTDIEARLKEIIDFLYMHAPRIRHYAGTFTEFVASTEAQNTRHKYWCKGSGTHAEDYHLKRYDYYERTWVDAGLWNGTAYAVVDLMATGSLTLAAYNALSANDRYDLGGKVNDAFIAAIVQDAKNHIGEYFVEKSLKFHYVFQNHFIAGTDNCSKNTYYALVPITENNVTTHKIELDQDDVDTVMATDNSGLQTKPYYVDRQHPYDDKDTYQTQSLYEGGDNVLFNLVEAMWESDNTLSAALNDVLTLMASMNANIEGRSAVSEGLTGCWGTLNKALFDIQRYIPAMAFNEAARIRYEFPGMIGYRSEQRSVDPIEQSMGDQLQSELQWMKRRLVYMASYAVYGEFSTAASSTGLSDASDTFSMNRSALPDGSTCAQFRFTLIPHQYIYPIGQNNQILYPSRHRAAPGVAYVMNIPNSVSDDEGVTLRGINYYRSIGNVGDNSFKPSAQLNIHGKRLTEFVCEPSVWYRTPEKYAQDPTAPQTVSTPTDGYLPAFRCSGVTVGSDNVPLRGLTNLSLKGCSQVGGGILNITTLTRLQTLDLRGTNLSQVIPPETSTLATIHLPASLTALSVTNCPALATLTMEGYANLTSVEVAGCPLVGEETRSIVIGMKDAGATASLLRLYDIAWTSQVTLPVLRWILSATVCDLTGSFSVDGTPNIDDVSLMITRFGNIRSESNRLYVTYSAASIPSFDIAGRKYVKDSMLVTRDGEKWWEDLSTQILIGNNIAVHTKSDGTTVPKIRWSLYTVSNGAITETAYTGTQAAFPDEYDSAMRIHGTAAQRANVLVGVKVEVTTENFTTQNGVTVYTGEQTVLTAQRIIGLWDRLPKVGDFAWTDGQFDDVNDPSKFLAGIVVKTDDTLDEDDNIIERECWVVACGGRNTVTNGTGAPASNAGMPGIGEVAATATPPWGPYVEAAGTNGFPATDTLIDKILNGVEEGGSIVAPGTKTWTPPQGIESGDYNATAYLTDHFDTPLKNYDQQLTIPKPTALSDAYRDAESAEGLAADGYKQSFANNSIKAFVMNFETKKENAILMSYADLTLRAAYKALTGDEVTIPRTPAEMASVLNAMYTSTGNTYTENGEVKHVYTITKLRQLLFPAARACNVWCPKDVYDSNGLEDGAWVQNNLCEEYRRGKWMLPSSGLLARIVNFYQNSKYADNNNIDENKEPYNGLSLEAFQPIFSRAIKKGQVADFSGTSNHWCSTEYSRTYARYVTFQNGYMGGNIKYLTFYVSRPVAAFKFVP